MSRRVGVQPFTHLAFNFIAFLVVVFYFLHVATPVDNCDLWSGYEWRYCCIPTLYVYMSKCYFVNVNINTKKDSYLTDCS